MEHPLIVPAVTRVLTEFDAPANCEASTEGIRRLGGALQMQALPDESAARRFLPLDPLTGLPKRAAFCEHLAPLLRWRSEKDTVPTEAALKSIRERHELPPQPSLSANANDPCQRLLEQRLRVALARHQFLICYQPLIERVSGRVIAVEALLRWRDPERGLVSPGAFLPTLVHTGLIVPVGEWVLTQAVRDFTRWHSIGLPKIRVAVNVSPTELARKDFAGCFLDIARQARNTPSIDIEISESTLLEDPEHLRQTLKTLRGEGVRVAIDDFGMAHSSLSRLSELPVDSLKIDRSLINRLSYQPQSQAVVTTIIALARAYGLRTVAEGVETIEQLEILDALGCEQSQGYLHSPAVTADELELLIAIRSTAARS